MTEKHTLSNPYERMTNLADARLGALAIACTDDFFADMNRMLQHHDPVWKEGVYDANGKWMDGWESRRKRGPGHDHCTVRLALPGRIKGLNIDTRYFTGNYAPSVSLEACLVAAGDPTEDTLWQPILASVSLQGDSQQLFAVDDNNVYSHVRLHMYPDGGVARLRVYGEVVKDWQQMAGQVIDLAAMENGGRALLCSDEHFGRMENILAPGRGVNMGDGWETARRREPGFDWVIIALGTAGEVSEIEVDTAHFKGNFPDSCSIQGAYVAGGSDDQMAAQSLYWPELLPTQKLTMDNIHQYADELVAQGPITHVRLNIFPDGGVSRLRIRGKVGEL
ncbi:MAG: allantoicase [Gammaproteobacteria bacterium]|jgi:allantoicase|nr:allantoicase [Gammaproteobacteria bacterium]